MIQFYLACVGITIIITQSSIFEKPREVFSNMGDFFDELIHCPMCMGFWVGIFLSFLYGKDIILVAPTSSLLSWVIFSIINLTYSITNYFLNHGFNEEIDEIQ